MLADTDNRTFWLDGHKFEVLSVPRENGYRVVIQDGDLNKRIMLTEKELKGWMLRAMPNPGLTAAESHIADALSRMAFAINELDVARAIAEDPLVRARTTRAINWIDGAREALSQQLAAQKASAGD